MKPTFMAHQHAALSRLKESGGRQLLFLCPGAGKTLTTLEYVKDFDNVLFVVPATLLAVWEQEAMKWGYTVPFLIRGTPKERERIFTNLDKYGGWYAIGYEMFLKEHKRLAKYKWNALVADESQKLKSPMAKVAKAFRKFSLNVPRCVLLSGTPIVNHWGDIWSQVTAIESSALYGNYYTFRALHAVMPVPGIAMITSWHNTNKILEMIKPYVFTIDKKEIQSNLPLVSTIDIPVALSSEERKVYDTIRDELLIELEGQEAQTVANAMVQVGRLRQAANGLVHFGVNTSSKAKALGELLETLQDEKVLIFSMYSQTVGFLAQELKIKHVITGSMSDKDAVIADWRKNGTALIGTSSMSTGLNLQEAHYVVQVELPWTKAEEDQRIARAWRTGQKSPVTVYNLMAEDTIDYKIKKLILKKSSIANEVASYTMNDLKEII